MYVYRRLLQITLRQRWSTARRTGSELGQALDEAVALGAGELIAAARQRECELVLRVALDVRREDLTCAFMYFIPQASTATHTNARVALVLGLVVCAEDELSVLASVHRSTNAAVLALGAGNWLRLALLAVCCLSAVIRYFDNWKDTFHFVGQCNSIANASITEIGDLTAVDGGDMRLIHGSAQH